VKKTGQVGTWAVESAATGEFLGWFHFRPGPGTDITNVDLGYRLHRSAWNQGYATEGSRGLISMGFTDLGVERVFAHTMTVARQVAGRRSRAATAGRGAAVGTRMYLNRRSPALSLTTACYSPGSGAFRAR
jgi:Acetyltransferase (GNAT) domain